MRIKHYFSLFIVHYIYILSFSLQIQDLGKRFYGRWLFRHLDLALAEGENLALIGTNGSGKSTLMRMIAGQLSASEGKCQYLLDEKKVPYEEMYRYISWTGPQVQLYPDFTLEEHIFLHFQFKKCLLPNPKDIISLLKLEDHAEKKLRLYSSGMFQRVKLGLALFSDSKLLLLDEPTANMDEANADYALQLIHQYKGSRILILASNLEREYKGMRILEIARLNP